MLLEWPIPPSVNHIWRRHGKSTYLSANYKRWLSNVNLCLLMRQEDPIAGPVTVDLVIHPGKGWRSNRDLDNIFKPVLDALCRSGLILDDNCSVVRQISASIGKSDGTEARLLVRVTPWEG